MSKIAVNEITNEAGTGGPTLPNGIAGGLTLGGDLTLDTNGIYLGGTGSANYLEDYEEGTFTPEFRAVTATYVNQEGYYTKIGKIVYCHGVIEVSSLDTTDPSGFGFGNLPFSVSSNQSGRAANGSLAPIYSETNLIQSLPTDQLGFKAETTAFLAETITTDGVSITFKYNAGYFRTSGVLSFSITYETTA